MESAPRDPDDPCAGQVAPAVPVFGRGRASALAFLVDGQAYFDAFVRAAEQARRTLFVVGWDLHSQAVLRPRTDGGTPSRLGAFLAELVRAAPELQVYVLVWDFAPLYLLERETLTGLKLALEARERLRFVFDGDHPSGASHHQKFVVVDDAVAFVGGMDLTTHRWDTRAHREGDPRRTLPGGQPYEPLHDVQVLVSGEAATKLGALARERWRRATGEELPAPEMRSDPWPAGLEPAVRDVEVSLVVTEPAFDGRPAVTETESAVRRAILGARESIFIENQYVTSEAVGEALASRLVEPDGPEVVIVTLQSHKGWLEQGTLGPARARLFQRLREADLHGRLYAYHAALPDGSALYIHSKVLVADDTVAYVGSANLSNRSMALDTECGVVLEAGCRPDVARAIAGLRDDLLGEHLGTGREAVERAIVEQGSLGRAVESLSGGERTLEPLSIELPRWVEDVVPEIELLDPGTPLGPELVAMQVLPVASAGKGEQGGSGGRSPRRALGLALGGLVLLTAVVVVGLAWRWTPLSEWLAPERLTSWAEPWSELPAAGLITIVAVAVLSAMGVPVSPLVVAVTLGFGLLEGGLYAWTGSMLSATAGFFLGRRLGARRLGRLLGRRVRELARRIGTVGPIGVAVARLVPVAPFATVNVAAGASGLRASPFLLGTALSLVPGIVLVAWIGDSLADAITTPSTTNLVEVVVPLSLVVLLAAVVSWRLDRAARGRAA